MEDYVEQFKTEILSLVPPDEIQNDLIWLFKWELSYAMKGLFVTSIHSNSVEAVLQEALIITSCLDLEDNPPDYTPND